MNLPDIHLDADICHIAPRLAVGFLFREAVANHLGSTESFKSRYPVRLGRLTGDAAKHHLDDEGRVEAESGCDSWRIRPQYQMVASLKQSVQLSSFLDPPNETP